MEIEKFSFSLKTIVTSLQLLLSLFLLTEVSTLLLLSSYFKPLWVAGLRNSILYKWTPSVIALLLLLLLNLYLDYNFLPIWTYFEPLRLVSSDLKIERILCFIQLTFSAPYYYTTTTITIKSSCHFLSPGASRCWWTQTLDLKMMRWVFYQCATSTGHLLLLILCCQNWLRPLLVLINRDNRIDIENASMQCLGIECARLSDMGLTSAEGQKQMC